MADITSEKPITFSRRTREVATVLEQAYWLAKRHSREWYAQLMSDEIPVSSDPIIDNQYPGKPLTANDIVAVIARCDALTADYEADNSAKLNVVVKASNLPLE